MNYGVQPPERSQNDPFANRIVAGLVTDIIAVSVNHVGNKEMSVMRA